MKQETEIWKTIPDYPDYMASNIGRIKSLNYNHTKEEKVLKQKINKKGYCEVALYKDGIKKYYTTHRLVATTFLSNPQNLPCINHKNEIKTDNRLENLEWCTQEYNINYGTRTERMAKAHQNPILQFDKNNNFIKQWESATQVSNELKFDNSQIGKCCKGKLKTCGGFKWGYVDDYEKVKFNIFDLNIYVKKAS